MQPGTEDPGARSLEQALEEALDGRQRSHSREPTRGLAGRRPQYRLATPAGTPCRGEVLEIVGYTLGPLDGKPGDGNMSVGGR